MFNKYKKYPRWDTFKIPNVGVNSSLGGAVPEVSSGVPVTPSVTPSNTPTPSITASPTVTPTNTITPTNSPTPSVTAQPTSTPTNTPTPSATPSIQSPADINNLQLWFDALSGASVSSWTNYGLLGGSLTQPTASFQPAFTTTHTYTNWGYTGNALLFQNRDTMTISFSETPFSAHTTYMVFEQGDNTGPNQNGFYSQNGSGSNFILRYLSGNLEAISEPTQRSRTQQIGIGVLFVGSGDTNTFFSAQTNDTNFTSSTSTTSQDTATSFRIGNDPGTNQTNALYVSEILRYNRILTAAEHSWVVNYLKTKYSY